MSHSPSEIQAGRKLSIKSESLRLEKSQVQLTPFGNGTDLTDLKRMRHYFISNKGNLQLAAQFYYAVENTALGNYTIEKGIFICGVIEIFGKRFEALFSIRESDGLLAYAKIPAMDLGFLQISASEFQKKANQSLPVPKDSVLSQFVTPAQEGIVFFLSAGQKEVSFYFDGSVGILGIIRADARIIYMNRQIAVDLSTNFLGILRISLNLLVEYGSFSSGKFEFELTIDTSGLTEKLTAVTKKIDEAVSRLRSKIDNAKQEIDFVVLGKKYNLKKEIHKQTFSSNPTATLSGAINDHIDSDIRHIEDGTFRSNWRKYQYKQYTPKENSHRLACAKEHLNSSIELMKSMQNTYAEELNIPLEECDEMNVSLLQALDSVENVLETGTQAGNTAVLGNAMGGLKRSMAAQKEKGIFRDKEWEKTQKLISEYDEARALHNQVVDSIKAVRKNRI